MTDPADCGPVTLAFCQDVQAQAYDWPEEFFTPKVWHWRRPPPDERELETAAAAIKIRAEARHCGGRRRAYSGAHEVLRAFVETHGIPCY